MAKNDLRTLIRLHKWQLDEKRKELGQHLRFEAALIKRKELLVRRYAEEEAVSKDDFTAAQTFGLFVDWYIKEQRAADAALEEVRAQILRVRDEIYEAFRTLKTYEITQDNRDKREKAELERKMSQVLDEIGLTLNRRLKLENAQETAEDFENNGNSGV